VRALLVGEAGPLEAALEEAGLQLTRDDVDAAYLVSVAPPVELVPLADLGADDWLRVFDEWATEVFFAVQPWLAASAARGAGGWVAVTSDIGTQPFPGAGAAGAGAMALHTLVRIAALEGGPDGVRANVVAPGWSEPAVPPDLDMELAVLDTPLRRLVTTADIASAVAWLLSPAAAHVTGEILRVDGGYTITRGSRPDPRRH
jgi:NAD(P)-dependent dehydrogenase (short-subunit alcohol dehydrogenase family)